jgi:hypothetical protein
MHSPLRLLCFLRLLRPVRAGNQARGGGLSGGRASRRGASAEETGAADSANESTSSTRRSGIASAPSDGSTAKAAPSAPVHQRGPFVGAGRELLFRCMGHITPAVWSQLHASAAPTASVPERGDAASVMVEEQRTASWHTTTASA